MIQNAVAIWERIAENAELCRKQERDIMAMILETRQRNSDCQEKASAAIARIEAGLRNSR